MTPDIEIQSIRGKELLIIRVFHNIGPYYLKSEGAERGVYVRFGSTNRAVDAEMLDSLRLLAKKISYDELPHPKDTLFKIRMRKADVTPYASSCFSSRF